MGFYSAIKKNEISLFAGKWMELESITLSEVSQVQKAKGCVFPLICGTQTQHKYKQHYEMQLMLKGGHIRARKGKKRRLR
jgi:hypothetical protein